MFAARPHAALGTGRANIRAMITPQKNVLELHHAGIGEQQCRIIARNQRAGCNNGMAMAGEKIKEALANFTAIHKVLLGGKQEEVMIVAGNERNFTQNPAGYRLPRLFSARHCFNCASAVDC